MSDIIMESEDALKQERLMAFWKENGSFILSMVLLTIVLTGAMSAYRTWDRHTREAQTAQVLGMVEAPDFPANIQTAFTSGELKLRKDLKALSVLQAVNALLQEDKTADAATLLSALAEDKSIRGEYRDLATVLWAQVNTDEKARESIEAALSKVAEDSKSPWQAMANYQYGIVLAGKENYKEAVEHMERIDTFGGVPDTLRARAQTLARVYQLKASR